MLKKITTILCAGLLLNLFFCSTILANDGEKRSVSKTRTKILSLGTGTSSRIEVTLYDKTKIKGYIGESDDRGFTVVSDENGQATKVNYSDVKKATGRNNLNGRWIRIGVIGLIIVGLILFATVSSEY
ncbi:MAG: hypothetical protein JSS81_02395 [Acidobacteria bacterium]|nr:hypothetical protein [Acidobacteriota bacterium]